MPTQKLQPNKETFKKRINSIIADGKIDKKEVEELKRLFTEYVEVMSSNKDPWKYFDKGDIEKLMVALSRSYCY